MSRVESQPVTSAALTHIVRNLRPRDRAEIFALRWDDDEDRFAFEICAIAGDLWRLWTLDGEPVAVNGVVPVRPGVVIAGAFGTPEWRRIIRPMTRWSRDFVIPCLKMSGYHRGEAYVLATHTDSRRWIELLGGEVETLLKGYGRHREDFLLYAWDLTQEGGSHVLRRRRRVGQYRSADVTLHSV
jgi:hypothetical protein